MAAQAKVKVVRIRFELDREEARRLAGDIGFRKVADVTRRIFNRANILTPVDTGNLRAHNKMKVRRTRLRAIGEVFNDANYAAAVHEGSGPYTIRARRRKALKFSVDGKTLYRRSVRHPGTKGRPWIATAAREIGPKHGFLWNQV